MARTTAGGGRLLRHGRRDARWCPRRAPALRSKSAGQERVVLACAMAWSWLTLFAFRDPVHGPGREVSRGTISKIEFEGNATITSDKIKPKLLSRVGQPLDQDKVEADLKTLMGTKWFSDVRYYLDESPPKSGKYALIFVVREMPLLTKVEFRGRKAIRLKEIEDTTELKAGNRADPTRTRLAVGQIQRLYQEKGYDLASVTLLEGGNPGDTKIVIEIFEGPKVKVHSISFVGNHFASAAQLKTKIGTRKPILGLFGKYHSDMLDEDRQKLIEYYHSQGFFEAKVTPVTRPGAEPGQVDLTFVVSEGTRYKVRNVIIEGNTQAQDREAARRPGAALGQAVHDGGERSRQEPDAAQVWRDRLHRRPDRVRAAVYQPARRRRSRLQDRGTRAVHARRAEDPGERAHQRQGHPPRGGDGRTVAGRGAGQEPDRDLPAPARAARVFHERPAAGQADQDRDRDRRPKDKPYGELMMPVLGEMCRRRGCKTRARARILCRRPQRRRRAGTTAEPNVPGLSPFGRATRSARPPNAMPSDRRARTGAPP